jgi:hypothetical protein
VALIRSIVGPKVRLVILADRDFGRAGLIEQCQKLGLDYLGQKRCLEPPPILTTHLGASQVADELPVNGIPDIWGISSRPRGWP